jgi:hypothetical protein
MNRKTGFIAVMIFAAAFLAFYVYGQAPADTQKQAQQQKLVPPEKPLENRVYKLEMKIADMERRLDVLEYKMKP